MFETAPFSEPVEIIGRVVIELAVSATVPDFDLWVQLYDVAPDGTAWNLSTPGTALQRASYRDGGPERKLVRPGETVRLRMDRLITANRSSRAPAAARRSHRSSSPFLGEPADRGAGVRERQRTGRRDPDRTRLTHCPTGRSSGRLSQEHCHPERGG